MYYQATVRVPANVLETAPTLTRLSITRGVIQQILVGFPAGCAGLVHVQVFHGGWQVCPWTPGEDLAWDGYVYEFQTRYPVVAEPYELVVRAWNEDDTYEHRIFVGVSMLEGEVDSSMLDFLRLLQAYAA
jgi:hypothetical protein